MGCHKDPYVEIPIIIGDVAINKGPVCIQPSSVNVLPPCAQRNDVPEKCLPQPEPAAPIVQD